MHTLDIENSYECYQFTLQLKNANDITDEMEDDFFKAGCDDALLYSSDNKVFLVFERSGLNFEEVVKSAINIVNELGYECILLERIKV